MINWQTLISELEARGWTRSALAEHCGVRYSTLSDIANGRSSEPRGNAAVRLYTLHTDGALPISPANPAPADNQQAA